MSAPTLPPVTVAKFKEATRLVDRLVDEKRDVFLDRMQDYRDAVAERSRRDLTAHEAAQIASAMLTDEDPVALAGRVQQSGLQVSGEPERYEMLLAAGAATAPEFIEAAQRFVALMEMPGDTFAQAREAGTLDDALDEAVDALDDVPMADAKARATAAFSLFSREAGAGDDPGEAVRLLGRMLRRALLEAIQMTRGNSTSLTGSLPSTDGPDGTSSTTPAGPTASDS